MLTHEVCQKKHSGHYNLTEMATRTYGPGRYTTYIIVEGSLGIARSLGRRTSTTTAHIPVPSTFPRPQSSKFPYTLHKPAGIIKGITTSLPRPQTYTLSNTKPTRQMISFVQDAACHVIVLV